MDGSRWGPVVRAASTEAPMHAGPSASPPSQPVTCAPAAYQRLSLLMLFHESTRRAYGRPLVDCPDLLSLEAALERAPCCVLLLAPPAPPPPPPGPGGHAATPAAAAPAVSTPAQTHTETPGSQCGGSTESGSSSAASGASGSSSMGTSGGAVADDTSGAGGAGSTAAAPGPSLRVAYMNRAAAEALRAGSGSGAGAGAGAGGAEWQPVEDAELLRSVLSQRGEPARGPLRALALRTACGDGCDGSDGPARITCQVLLYGVMSPNGACAGAALLFDRWEVPADSPSPSSPSPSAPPLALGRPGVPEVAPPAQPGGRPGPSAAEVAALQEDVRAAADAVRSLKAQQGLGNTDPAVVSAVAALQALKARLALAERLVAAFGAEPGAVAELLAARGEAAAAGQGGESQPL